MSCSVVAIPWALYAIVPAIIGAAVRLEAALEEKADNPDYSIHHAPENTYVFPVDEIVNKEYETQFMDKDILLKTLEEHGVTNIQEMPNGSITGNIDNFSMEFVKHSPELPYVLKLACKEQDCANEKVGDISSEYALNVQEAAYLSIVEKLKENNMQIENETVEDDNTIVLTINLE